MDFSGLIRNPWNPEEGASGSSAGSAAAVAAGFCAFSIGTDTLGSTIMPAERCGVVGLRPSFGSIDISGVMPVAQSLDKIGLLVRTAEDLPFLLERLVDPVAEAAGKIQKSHDALGSLDPCDIRLGYVPSAFRSAPTDTIDRQALDAAYDANFSLEKLVWPDLPFASLRKIMEVEAAANFASIILEQKEDALLRQDDLAWPNLWRRAWRSSAVDHELTKRFRKEVVYQFQILLRNVDALITPHHAGDAMVATSLANLPCIALPYGTMKSPPRDLFNQPLNSGPAVSVPRGIALVGKTGEEARLCAIAQVLENVFPKQPRLRGFVC